jgi:hypothetical protein
MEELIKAKIVGSRPHIKPNSLKVYLRNITKLLKITKQHEETICECLVKEPEKVLKCIKDAELTKSMRKNIHSVLLVLYGCDNDKCGVVYDKYVKALKECNDSYIQDKLKQEKTEIEEKKWVKLSKLRSVLKIYKQDADKVLQLTTEAVDRNWHLFDTLQKYVVASLYLMTDALPPRRNIYANVKMINYDLYEKLTDEEYIKHNWLIIPTSDENGNNKNRFRFIFTEENYKTGWKYGDQIFKIRTNSKLLPVLNMWSKYNINKDRWLLLNPKMRTKMTTNGLTKYLTQIFSILGNDKKISTSMIRKIYLSDVYKKDTKLNKRIHLAKKMGHDHQTAQIHYEKH